MTAYAYLPCRSLAYRLGEAVPSLTPDQVDAVAMFMADELEVPAVTLGDMLTRDSLGQNLDRLTEEAYDRGCEDGQIHGEEVGEENAWNAVRDKIDASVSDLRRILDSLWGDEGETMIVDLGELDKALHDLENI